MSIVQSCMKLATGEANDNGLDEYQPPKTRKKANTKSAENVNSNNTRAHEDVAPGEIAIREDNRNYRKHSEQNLKLIGNSLKAYGAGRSIVADNSGAVIGGNGTLRQANKLGIKQRIVHTTGDELVVVVRDDIAPDDPRRQELAVMDNSTTDSSEFDFDLLQADFNIDDLSNMGVSIPEVNLMGDVETDFPELKSGDKEPFQQMTFTLADAQAEIIKDALADAKTNDLPGQYDNYGNENSNGNALAAIIREWSKNGN